MRKHELTLFFLLTIASSLLLFAGAALADDKKITAIFINNTPLEIMWVKLNANTEEGSGSMGGGFNAPPGTDCGLGFGGAVELTEINLDMGLYRFKFTDLSALKGHNQLNLGVGLDDKNIPFLEFKAEGNAEPLRVKGELSNILPDKIEKIVPLSELLHTETMAEVRKVAEGHVRDMEKGKALELVVEAGGQLWLASVLADGDSGSVISDYKEEEAKPGVIVMRIEKKESTIQAAFETVYAMGMRPWFMQFKEGTEMNTTAMLKMREEEPDLEKARQRTLDAFLTSRPQNYPGSIGVLLIPEQAYKDALKDKPFRAAGWLIRCSNSIVLELRFIPDCSALVSNTK